MSAVLDLSCELIRRPSVTPEDAGCQQLLAERLLPLGFEAEWCYSGEVTNLLLTRPSPVEDAGRHVLFLGHTDVVPSGPEEQWRSPPFEPTVDGELLFGRGAADMKGSVAAMVVAMERYVGQFPQAPGRLSLLLTSDEEGPAKDGIRVMAEFLRERDLVPDDCIVGEPSSREQLGDTIRVGRRGSINAILTLQGVQGHTAYGHLNDNPIHRLGAILTALVEEPWDEGSDDFPPTSLQCSNVHAGTGASNVTPGQASLWFNIRNNPASPAAAIERRIRDIIKAQGVGQYQLDWDISGEPFHTEPGVLSETLAEVVKEVTGVTPELNTGGGTSDGRFMAPLGCGVVEIGPVNASIHKLDEHVNITDLERLMVIYFEVMRRLLPGTIA